MNHAHRTYLVHLFLLFTISDATETNPARLLSLQGMMQNANGQRMDDGKHYACFRLYASKESTSKVWSQCDTLQVENGMYHTLLGESTPLPFANGKPAWLELTVDQELLAGRIPLTGSIAAWTSASVTDSIFPGTGMGPGVGVRSINSLRNDIVLESEGNVEIKTNGTVITLKGNDAYTAAEIGRVDMAVAHALSRHIPVDSFSVVQFSPVNHLAQILATGCTQATEGAMFFRSNYWSDGRGTLMYCTLKQGIYTWVSLQQ